MAILAVAVTATIIAGCGGGGGAGTSASDAEKAADVQILNYALAHELTTVDAFTRALPRLGGPDRAAPPPTATPPVNSAPRRRSTSTRSSKPSAASATPPPVPPCGVTRRRPERTPKRYTSRCGRPPLRGATRKRVESTPTRCTAVAPTPFDSPPPRTRAEALAFLYGIENSTIRNHITEIGRLTTTWPRVLLTSIVANEGQQQVLLRRAMGAAPLATVPEAFEIGDTPPPASGATGTPPPGTG